MRTPDAKLFSVPPTRSRVHDNLRNIQIVAPAASPDRGLLLNYTRLTICALFIYSTSKIATRRYSYIQKFIIKSDRALLT